MLPFRVNRSQRNGGVTQSVKFVPTQLLSLLTWELVSVIVMDVHYSDDAARVWWDWSAFCSRFDTRSILPDSYACCLLHQSTFSKCEETTRHLLHKLTFRRTKSELQKHAVCALGFMVISISAFGKCGAEWAMRWTAAKCSGEWWSLWFSRLTKSSINIFSMSTEN